MNIFTIYSLIQSEINIFGAYTVWSMLVYQGKQKILPVLKTVVNQPIIYICFKKVHFYHVISYYRAIILHFLSKSIMRNLFKFLVNVQIMSIYLLNIIYLMYQNIEANTEYGT